MASWMMAEQAGGVMVLRMEDLDPPRTVAGSAERIAADLEWLGIRWDGEIVWQSRRTEAYEAAIGRLSAAGLVYPCDCSRAEIARVASAPHEGEEVVYPGTCRDQSPSREMKRPPALRLRTEGVVSFDDLAAGPFTQDLARDVGDFVLRRGDGVFAYQLAVAVDDAESKMTHVVRGRDLLASTPRQLHLMRLLGAPSFPVYAHVPLVVGHDGSRLSKRTPGSRVRALREAGVTREEIIEWLTGALGASSPGDPIVWPTSEVRIPIEWTAE